MKQFATILFVLIFAIAGSSFAQNYSQRQINGFSGLLVKESSAFQFTIFLQDSCFDLQDNNELDGFDIVSVFSDSEPCFHHSEKEKITVVIPRFVLPQFGELLLDLPPPVLSV